MGVKAFTYMCTYIACAHTHKVYINMVSIYMVHFSIHRIGIYRKEVLLEPTLYHGTAMYSHKIEKKKRSRGFRHSHISFRVGAE